MGYIFEGCYCCVLLPEKCIGFINPNEEAMSFHAALLSV